MIDKKELFAFKTLAEILHFGRASEKCHMTPSALTRLIQKIEQSLDVMLFERDNRNIKLTDSGKIYYQFALEILQKYEDLSCTLHPEDRQMVGNIRLYCTVTASYVVLPNIIRHIHTRYPKIKIQLTTGSIKDCTHQLEEDKTDAVIAILSDDIPSQYCVKALLETKMVLIVPKSSNVNNIKEAVEKVEFIRPAHYIGDSDLGFWFQEQKLKPKIYSDVDGNEAILSLVSSGMGMSILPEIVISHSHLAKYVKVIDTTGLPSVLVGLIMRKQSLMSPIKSNFWKACTEIDKLKS
ncbi:HTH-type transcriptional activator IlvY [Francisellaceae bacterium]|nr:HTH-type transcriptional activator IlvY [Francisellaceae bacterium]